MSYSPIFEHTRGDQVESLHYGAVAVADSQGTLLAWWGDPQVITFLRSSAKPFQALPLVESGAAEHYGLRAEQIAIVCASHIGTDEHVRVVSSIHEAVGLSEVQLMCGTHPPGDQATARRLEQAGLEATPIRHNCSGKHSGMLALAKYLGSPLESYLEPRHAVQVRVLETFAEMCALEPSQVLVGTDGCSAPNFAVPLVRAATAFARLVDPAGLEQGRARACRTVVAAMRDHPQMVSGEGRFDTLVMQIRQGDLISKGGAEGYQGFGLHAGACGPGSPAMGVAIKISDGGLRPHVLSAVSLSVLEQLGALGGDKPEPLARFGPQSRKNQRDLVIGQERVSLALERG